MIHDLKIHPHHFQAIADGRKTFEVRSIADRVFDEGDTLRLHEWIPDEECYTGRKLTATVTLVHAGLGMAPGYAALAIKVAGPKLFFKPSELGARELVAERIAPKDPEGDLRDLVVRALNLEASASKTQIVYTVQALNSRSIERGKALLQEEEKTRALTDERDALRAENQRLKRLVSNPRNAGIPASRSHEFVIHEDGSVAHIDVIPFGGDASWSLRSAAQILVDREEAKRGKTPLLEEVTETQIQHAFRAGQPIEVLVRGKVVERIDGLVRVSWAIGRTEDTWFAFPTKEGGAA